MMNRLQWFFDLSAAEWSIILAVIIALMILAFMLIRRSPIALYKRSKTAVNQQTGIRRVLMRSLKGLIRLKVGCRRKVW